MPSVTDMFLDPDIHPEVGRLGPSSSGGFLKDLLSGGVPGLGDVAGIAKGLFSGGGTNVRQSTSVSQATNVAVNPIINNIIGSGTGGGTTSGYATGSPSASASVAGDTLPGYLPGSGYGATLYSGRPYGSISAYDTLPASAAPPNAGSDLGMILLIGAAVVGVMLFAGK